MLSSVLAGPAEWRCWQTGIELKYADTTLIRIRELLGYLRYSPDYRKMRSGSRTLSHTMLSAMCARGANRMFVKDA